MVTRKTAAKKAAAKKSPAKKAPAKKAAAKKASARRPAAKKAPAGGGYVGSRGSVIGAFLLCSVHGRRYPRGETCPRCP